MDSNEPLRILVTAFARIWFSPYDMLHDNRSAEILARLPRSISTRRQRVEILHLPGDRLLPVGPAATRVLARQLRELSPDGCLMMGENADQPNPTNVEIHSDRRRIEGPFDFAPLLRLQQQGAPIHFDSAFAKQWVATHASGAGPTHRDSIARWWCNAVYRQGIQWSRATDPPRPVVFLHLGTSGGQAAASVQRRNAIEVLRAMGQFVLDNARSKPNHTHSAH
jgi:pyrrolidone-carboxylate peptidase